MNRGEVPLRIREGPSRELSRPGHAEACIYEDAQQGFLADAAFAGQESLGHARLDFGGCPAFEEQKPS